MNLRILKKLSKRAAPYLVLLGDTREQFRSERGDNYHGFIIRARKHADRVASCHTDMVREGMILTEPKCRASTRHPFIKLYPPSHPRKGTMMVGGMSGYYEREWDEECAYGALWSWVSAHFTDWSDFENLRPTRDLSSVSKLFAAADDMVRERSSR